MFVRSFSPAPDRFREAMMARPDIGGYEQRPSWQKMGTVFVDWSLPGEATARALMFIRMMQKHATSPCRC
jgi:hypothetical protein